MPTLDPDERAFRQHVAAARFQIHVDRAHWRVAGDSWPHPVIAVRASPRTGAPAEVALRFDLNGYPVTAPTSAPWDVQANAPLAHELWPTGGRVAVAFNPNWNGGTAIYIPCDRLAIVGHDAWRDAHRAYLWDPTKDIVDYLKVIHDLLHSPEYSGIRRAA
jgi:hypothetical protein